MATRKITEKMMQAIRQTRVTMGLPYRELAEIYNISISTVYTICHGKTIVHPTKPAKSPMDDWSLKLAVKPGALLIYWPNGAAEPLLIRLPVNAEKIRHAIAARDAQEAEHA